MTGHHGVRRRIKARWLMGEEGDAHAVRIGTGGTLESRTLCGLPIRLNTMYKWASGLGRARCKPCGQAVKVPV